jgi:hypothetical protein
MNGRDDRKPPEGEGRPETILDTLRSLSLRAAVDLFAFADRLKELRDSVDGTPFAGSEGSGIASGPRPDGREIAFDFLKLHLDLAGQLMSLGERQTDLVFDRLRRLGAATSPEGRRPVLAVSCSGAPGEPGRWPVFVYNAGREVREIELRPCGEWRRSGALTEFPCRPYFADRDALIAAHTDRTATVLHDPPLGMPAGTYAAEVDVFLRDRCVGRLGLTWTVQA